MLETLVIAATTPPTFTVTSDDLVGKLLPVMVTDVPGAPLLGETPVIDGAFPPGGASPPGGVGEWSHEFVAGGMFQNLAANSRRGEHMAYSGPSFIVPED